MDARVKELAAAISGAVDPFSSSDHRLLYAHEIIAKTQWPGLAVEDSWIAESEFGEGDLGALRDALISYAERHRDHPSRSAAYWGLGALMDRGDLGLFRRFLLAECQRSDPDAHAIWQLMVALDNIGESILGDASSVLDPSVLTEARRYLNSLGLLQ